MNYNALQLAVMNHQEKVFNFIFEISSLKNLLLMSKDIYGNNVLHLAGKLAPEYKLNLILGEAMQLKHELHWFKEIEKLVHPHFKEDKNVEGKTPATVFSEEHKELVKNGEEWMKSAATSSLGAVALIATIAFVAIMTIPSNYNDEGRPNFNKQTTFLKFGVSDTISMFSSLVAIIMIFSIFTSRYAEEDFLQALPRKLIHCHHSL
ncbi:hypothetical protein Pint_12055 [Pistacia integerrima]|uniref:Uncharacterized protein n=1 Tax=Pistacia integerrima TaxID=434235 RepID=A0ACC0XF39_9ROSI|nr:hypothetical protein Pint_12055 [Pistacia integerrima]